MSAGFRTFDATIQKTREWMKAVEQELGIGGDQIAYNSLKAVLQTLRDRLSVDEAVQLGEQLPLFLKGVYYEGWQPHKVPRHMRTRDDFYAFVAERLPERDILEVDTAVNAVLTVLSKRVSLGQIEDIKATLPEDLASIWPGRNMGFDVEA